MIDPHVHLRDWGERHKETIEHGLSVADRIGLAGVFDMPNTSPAITTRELIEKRLADAKKVKGKVFYGLYAGVTSDPNQIKEVVKAWKELFPGVVGLKMFAGPSVGNLGIIKEEEQKLIYKTLAEEKYDGVQAVHCEKNSLLRPELWCPKVPISHYYARPLESESSSVKDQIKFAQDYKFPGVLHICHVSVPKSVELIESARKLNKVRITCGATPHHCLLNYDLIPSSQEGLLYKVNPPIRNADSSKKMLSLLKEGKIDWIETDHAPHTLDEKIGKFIDAKGNPQYMSGFPGLPFYPHFLNILKANGFSEEQIKNLTHGNICDTFDISLNERNITPDMNLHGKYEVDVYKGTRK